MFEVEGVVFDMDGLLLDTEPLHQDAWRRAAADLGFALDDKLNRSLIGGSECASLNKLSEAFGDDFSPQTFIELCTSHWERYVVEHGITIKPGAVMLLELLETAKVLFAIATSSHQHNTRLSLGHAGLTDRFYIIVTGDQITHGKPAPDIYLEAARRLQVSPSNCLAFEDSTPGLLAATSAGMTTILVPDLIEPSTQTIKKAFEDLPSLEPAHALVSTLIHQNGAR